MESDNYNFADALSAADTKLQHEHMSWYGVALDAADQHSLAKLLGSTKSTIMQLLERSGFQLYNNIKGQKLQAALKAKGIETTFIRYKGERRCVFVRLGKQQKGCASTTISSTQKDAPIIQPLVLQLCRKAFMDQIPPATSTSGTTADGSNDRENTGMSNCNKHPSKVTQLDLSTIIEERLISTIFKGSQRSIFNLCQSDFSQAEVIEKIIDWADELRGAKEEHRSNMLALDPFPEDVVAGINTPTLACYGIRQGNVIYPHVINGIMSDILKLNNSSETPELLDITSFSGRPIRLVQVPLSKGLDRVERNNRRHNWIPRLLSCLGNNGKDDYNEEETAAVFMTCLGKMFPLQYAEVAPKIGDLIVVTRMIASQTFAMMSEANLGFHQQVIVCKHIAYHCGCRLFVPVAMIQCTLGGNFIIPFTGRIKNGNERIDWSFKNPTDIIRQHLTDNVASLANADHIDCVLTIDHGQGASRATLTWLHRTKLEDGSWTEVEQSFSVAEARCKKDNYDILNRTFAPKLDENMGELMRWKKINVYRRNQTTELYFVIGPLCVPRHPEDTLQKEIKIETWFAADLKMMFIALGRENFDTVWCFWCNLTRQAWQASDHEEGAEWTRENLSEKVEAMKELGRAGAKITAQARQGVRDNGPLLKSFQIWQYIIPVLHLLLGLGNSVIEKFVANVQAICEEYTKTYTELEKETTVARQNYEQYRRSELSAADNILKLQAEDAKAALVDEAMNTENAVILKEELKEIKMARDALKQELKKKKKKYDEKKKDFKVEAKKPENSKASGQPIQAAIEAALHEILGMSKGASHGGEYQGNDLRNFMKGRELVFTKFREIIDLSPSKKFLNDDIKQMIDMFERLTGHLDGFFSIANTKRFHIVDRMPEKAAKHMEHAGYLWRRLGIPVPPKLHIAEKHSVPQIEKKKGIGDLGEKNGEVAHQLGRKADARSGGLRGGRQGRANSHSKWERLEKNPYVLKQKDLVARASKRKFKDPNRESAADRKANRKISRDEDRDGLLLVPLPRGEYTSLIQRKKEMLLVVEPAENEQEEAEAEA